MYNNQRYKRMDSDNGVQGERHRDERRRSRSKSKSRSRRHRDRSSRSRTQSVDRHRRRYRRSNSRSKSRSHSVDRRSREYGSHRKERRYSSRRHRDSRSRSRSQTSSHSRRHSRTPTRSNRDSRKSHTRNLENREEKRLEDNAKGNVQFVQIARDDSNASAFRTSSTVVDNLRNLPLPKRETVGAYYNLPTEGPIDKERIHREIEEKLRQTLAKEGKVYPPPKPEATHPVFANDGSFLEVFKKMQEAQLQQQPPSTIAAAVPLIAVAVATTPTGAYVAANALGKSAPPPPIVGRRRGGKILKTGVVAKPKVQSDSTADPKDFWALYLAEVNKYKNNACESDGGTRPLVK